MPLGDVVCFLSSRFCVGCDGDGKKTDIRADGRTDSSRVRGDDTTDGIGVCGKNDNEQARSKEPLRQARCVEQVESPKDGFRHLIRVHRPELTSL